MIKLASPLISDSVRNKVNHMKFYFVAVKWRAVLRYQDTEFNYVTKDQAKNLVRLISNNPFVDDIKVFDNEGNIKHFSSKYDETYASELLKQLWAFGEDVDEMKVKHTTNFTWQKILLERKNQLKEAKAKNPDKKCKLFKGRVMIKGVNCMINGPVRADGAEFPPDCEDWWK